MPPQDPGVSTQPQPNYDFIYNNPPQKNAGGKFKLPGFGKPLVLLAGVGVIFVVVIIVALVIPKGGVDKQPYLALIGRSGEIVRVSDLVKIQSKDADTQAIISTTEAAMISDRSSLVGYLAKNGVKLNDKELLIYTNTKTDAQMKDSAQNGTIDVTYRDYLKSELQKYEQQLETAYKVSGKQGKDVLVTSINSTRTLLSSPQLANN